MVRLVCGLLDSKKDLYLALFNHKINWQKEGWKSDFLTPLNNQLECNISGSFIDGIKDGLVVKSLDSQSTGPMFKTIGWF